ncbi:hypothetical protein FHW36_101598 [Chitinophaga polysaccharea]|uniref:Uncharacterized protein n=1 Tax=Chitinophaga polysaccharea TaxID=1293035 RepID=A0A561Q2U0_9BACT|nr:hypothetical protein [Chitinophaga polysaccharea]TWF44677.1 hypothetical protein FHW36_101598 [Chitinophaga polysaccharea]
MNKSVNTLLQIHTMLSKLPVIFRERVCEECNWSTPTFYRKMRGRDKPHPTDSKKVIPSLSNAEKQKIIEVMNEVYYQAGTDKTELLPQ